MQQKIHTKNFLRAQIYPKRGFKCNISLILMESTSITEGMAQFGVTWSGQECSFTLFSDYATGVLLRLFAPGEDDPFLEAPLSRQGDIWSITLKNLPETFEYTYRCEGPYDPKEGHLFNHDMDLVDPYATRLNTPKEWNGPPTPSRGFVTPQAPFDWDRDSRPLIPTDKLILYEMHVRGFTQHPTSGVKHPGTFLGLIEKIPYLKSLGINAVELLPIHTFNEREVQRRRPGTGERLFNYWGYSTLNFFTPMGPYGTPEELKEMVKALHKEGIEVILDVVYNHTGEGSNANYYHSFRGIDNKSYYIVDENGYHNYSGCGNTFNCNHPMVQELILDSLRHFVTEYHVDGFRFDLAPILGRGEDGKPLEHPPLIEKITRDPILAPTKLIAEAWDAAGLYQVGSFPSYRFGEWNDRFRDDVRSFIRGDGNLDAMKKRLEGSHDLFQTPDKSYNFVTIHDGFSLHDLVSYNEKHNEDNDEKNQDGANDNHSWNCGVEGETDDPEILALREKQMKNFFHALLIAKGIPMVLMGDEYGHTKKGNNNTYCQDNALNYFQWNQLKKSPLPSSLTKLIEVRKNLPKEITWIECAPALALQLGRSHLSAFNPTPNTVTLPLPEASWKALFDSGATLSEKKITLAPFSSALLTILG